MSFEHFGGRSLIHVINAPEGALNFSQFRLWPTSPCPPRAVYEMYSGLLASHYSHVVCLLMLAFLLAFILRNV
jgi:hypothetical protein